MPNSHEFIIDVNRLLAKLDESGDLNTGIEVANQVVRLLGTHDTKEADLVVDEHVLQLPNAERYDRWFHNHPWMGGERAAFELTDAKDMPIQAKFYWLQKRSRQFIAGSVHFTENWEDADYTHNDNFKVGIDFFLAPNGRSVIVALSNRGNIRVVELQHKLNNTQVDIFTKWRDAIQISSTEALHTTLWESFKLQSVNKDFYTGVANSFTELLQHLKSIGRDEEDAKLFASRLLGRLLFVWFLRKKDIIDESLGYFDASSDNATNYYKRSLERLFFNTLNTPIDDRDEFKKEFQKSLFPESDNEPQAKLFQVDNKTPYLNGGLFEPHDNDWYKDSSLTFPEGFFTNLYNHFDQFNFTTDESSPEYEQVAIDPEMLGRVFESLLATQVDETGKQARKAKGAFYTPREIVSYMCRESLRNYLYGAKENDERYKKAVDELLNRSDHEWAGAGTNSRRDAVPKEYRAVIVEALDTVMILDPACGSGAFPMGMLQLLIKTYERLEGRFDPYKTKLQIVQNNIFGVDIEPMAVEISRLRAWLSLIVDEDDSRDVAPLPNLDFKFVCANSLIPLDDSKADLFNNPELHKQLAEIRQTYFNARKPHTKRAAQQKYYKLAGSNTGLFDNLRTRQLKSFDPFINSHPADFFDIDQMFGIDEGFDIVIGNPPYVQLKKGIYPSSSYPYSEGKDKGKQNLYKLFIELSYNLSKKEGTTCLIVQSSLMGDISAQYTRELLISNTHIKQVVEFPKKSTDSSSQVFDTVLQGTCVVLFAKRTPTQETLINVSIGNNTKTILELSFASIQQTELLEVYPVGYYIPLLVKGDAGILETIDSKSTQLKHYIKKSSKGDLNLGTNSSNFSEQETGVKLFRGRNINRYKLSSSVSDYIIGNFKQELVKENSQYVFIVGQNVTGTVDPYRLIFCLSNQEPCLWGDSANKVLLKNESLNYIILGILNSTLMDWYFRKTSSNNHVNGYEIESLPIPKQHILDSETAQQLDHAVKNIFTEGMSVEVAQRKVDKIVYKLYGLSDADIQHVEQSRI
ncbi:hypothetical protein EOM60_00305 [Candidatus Saccharibacteria bacterium]|nr:hypothetical protein [Candidatus Saccharibacteria bacterium]